MLFLQALTFDIIVDIGSETFQVGTLRRVGSGNPIEALLNTQSKRQSQTIVAYDGEQLYVAEHAAAYFRKNPGPVFKNFMNEPTMNLAKFANLPGAAELSQINGYQSVLLVSAVMNHIITSMVNKPDSQIDVTLIHPPSWSTSHITSFKGALAHFPNTTLFATVPTPNAVVITHLSNRINEQTKESLDQQHVVIDVGASSTEVSLVKAQWDKKEKESVVTLKSNIDLPVGGSAITECLIKHHIVGIPGLSPDNYKLYKRVSDSVDKAKIALTGNVPTSKVVVESALGAHQDFSAVISKANVDECVDEVFNDQELSKLEAFKQTLGADVQYLFYGGSSRVPRLQAKFETLFNTTIAKTVNLDEGAIFGGGMITARHVSGFKMTNKFNSLDDTKPFLVMDNTTELFRLNPQIKSSNLIDFPMFIYEDIELKNKSYNVTSVNETSKYVIDENGERKKQPEQTVNTETIEYQDVELVNPFKRLSFKATQGKTWLFDYDCNMRFREFNWPELALKYEYKGGNYGNFPVRAQKLTDLREQTEEHNKKQKELLKVFKSDEDQVLKLQMNFSTDATATPSLLNIALVVETRKTKKDDPKISKFPLNFDCKTVVNPDLMVEADQHRQIYDVIKKSNEIKKKWSSYEETVNQIENIANNAFEFVEKYAVNATEIEGNFMVYKTEIETLNSLIGMAKEHLEKQQSQPPCQDTACLDQRLEQLTNITKQVNDLRTAITNREEYQKCRGEIDGKYNTTVDQMVTALSEITNFTESDKGKLFKESMDNCKIVRAVEIDAVSNDTAGEVVELKTHRIHKEKPANATKDVIEKIWFEDLFAIYGHLNNKTAEDLADLQSFTTKAMLKKLKKATTDCGYLNASYQQMLKGVDMFTKQDSMIYKSIIDFRTKVLAELSTRPETSCEIIKNNTNSVEKIKNDIEKKLKDVRNEIDKTKLEKLVEQLYTQAVDHRRRSKAKTDMLAAMKENKTEDAMKILSQEAGVEVTAEQIVKILDDSTIGKLEEALTNDQIEKTVGDVVQKAKDLDAEVKKKIEDEKKAAEEAAQKAENEAKQAAEAANNATAGNETAGTEAQPPTGDNTTTEVKEPEAPKEEPLKLEEPVIQEPKVEEPVVEPPKEEPKVEEPVKEEPKVEEPKKEEQKQDPKDDKKKKTKKGKRDGKVEL